MLASYFSQAQGEQQRPRRLLPREVRQKARGRTPGHGDLRQLPHTLCHARRGACQKALSQVNYRKAIPLSPVERQKASLMLERRTPWTKREGPCSSPSPQCCSSWPSFLLLRRSQPLGELIPAPETARVDGLFCISTIVPTPDGYGTFDTGDCRVEGYPDSEAAAALRSAMSEISVQRYYRLPTSLFSRFTQNWNYVTIWWIPEDGQKHDLYLNWDEGFIYDDANRAVAYKIDGDAQQVFSELCAVISEYGTYTR